MAWMKMLQIDAVVDYMQLLRRQSEAALDFLPHHVRVADHGAQARMFEHAPLGGTGVVMVRIEGDAEAFRGAARRAPDVEPLGVNTIACAVQITAGDAFMRLHEIELAGLPRRARRARKRCVAPGVAEVKRIHAEDAPRAPALGAPRDQCQFRPGTLERGQRALDEAFGAAIRVVALPDDGNAHRLSVPRRAAAGQRAAPVPPRAPGPPRV